MHNKHKLRQYNQSFKRDIEKYRYKEIKKILIYFRFHSVNEIQDLMNKAKSLFPAASCSFLMLKENIQKEETFDINYFSYNDCNILMKPNESVLQKISNEKYDVFISLINENELNFVDENILVMNNAKIRVGLYLNDKPYCLDVFCDTKSSSKVEQLQNIDTLLRKIN